MKLKFIMCLVLASTLSFTSRADVLNKVNFGASSISKDLFFYILNVLDKGKIILELGSGFGTGQLAKHFTMYSVEHNAKWVNLYESIYIYAPIKKYKKYSWYDVTILGKSLPKKYDMILVDGPPGNIGRYGFFENLQLFNTDVLMIFDDVQREPELKLLKDVALKLNKTYAIYSCSDGKLFGVINEGKIG